MVHVKKKKKLNNGIVLAKLNPILIILVWLKSLYIQSRDLMRECMRSYRVAFKYFIQLFFTSSHQGFFFFIFYFFLPLSKKWVAIENQIKPCEKPKPTYSPIYYDPGIIFSHVQKKAQTLTHLQTRFLLPHVQMKLKSQDPDSFRSSLSLYKLPFRLHTLFSFSKKNSLQSRFSNPI